MNVGASGELNMSVFNHNKRLVLAEAAKHAGVAIIAEPIVNITGGIKVQLTEKQLLEQERLMELQLYSPGI